MKKQLGYTLAEVMVVLVILLGVGGWVANIVKMIYAINDPLTAMFLFRAAGIFVAPLGAILGFF